MNRTSKLAIQLALKGCGNRPFFHIIVAPKIWHNQEVKEQIGSYDPMPNENNEKLVAINLERLQYWIAQGTVVTKPVGELLGLSGYLPIHPLVYMKAWRKRKAELESSKEQSQEIKQNEMKVESN